MAQPTFHRSGRSVRRTRLRRTVLLGLLLAAGVAFAVGKLTGGGEAEKPIAKVAFTTTVRGEGAPKPPKGAAEEEAAILQRAQRRFARAAR